MEAHNHGGGNGTDAKRIDFCVEQVLDCVPAHGPSEAGEVDHDDGSSGGVSGSWAILHASNWLACDGEEEGDVQHGECLEADTEG